MDTLEKKLESMEKKFKIMKAKKSVLKESYLSLEKRFSKYELLEHTQVEAVTKEVLTKILSSARGCTL